MLATLLANTPLWIILLGTIAMVSAVTELGYRYGLYRNRKPDFDDETRINAMTGAHLGLLAFVMAFSFNLAAGHHSVRKQLVVEEVNAMETTYLRTELVAPDVGRPIRALLRDYVATRTALPPQAEAQQRIIAESERIQDEIWEHVSRLADNPAFGPRDALLVDAVNELFDIHGERVFSAAHQRVPPSIWTMLYAILNLSMFGMGYFSGMKGRRSSVSRLSLTVSLAMILFLIADLDRPISGLVRADLQLIQDYHQKLQADSTLP